MTTMSQTTVEFCEDTSMEFSPFTPKLEGGDSLVFVYGTLMRGFGLYRTLRAGGAKFKCEGRIKGRLYSVGAFPGLKLSDAEQRPMTWVLGEVYRVDEALLRELDLVEGADRPKGEELYRRVAVRCNPTDVRFHMRDNFTVWVYDYQHPVHEGCHIATGDWREWTQIDSKEETDGPPPGMYEAGIMKRELTR